MSILPINILIHLGFRLNGPSTLLTKRKSRSFSILYSSTILELSYIIPQIKPVLGLSWLLLNAGNKNKIISCATIKRRGFLQCSLITITLCTILFPALFLQLNILWLLIPESGDQIYSDRIRFLHRPQVLQV